MEGICELNDCWTANRSFGGCWHAAEIYRVHRRLRDSIISASLRIGLGGHRCQAEICTLRHGARAQHLVQDSESGIFAEGRQERNYLNVSGTVSLLQVGIRAFSLVKHSVSSSCSDLNLLVLLLHSPISTKLDCSPGLFPFRLWEKQTFYCPISSLLLKIGLR